MTCWICRRNRIEILNEAGIEDFDWIEITEEKFAAVHSELENDDLLLCPICKNIIKQITSDEINEEFNDEEIVNDMLSNHIVTQRELDEMEFKIKRSDGL